MGADRPELRLERSIVGDRAACPRRDRRLERGRVLPGKLDDLDPESGHLLAADAPGLVDGGQGDDVAPGDEQGDDAVLGRADDVRVGAGGQPGHVPPSAQRGGLAAPLRLDGPGPSRAIWPVYESETIAYHP